MSGVGALWDCVPRVCGGGGGCAGGGVPLGAVPVLSWCGEVSLGGIQSSPATGSSHCSLEQPARPPVQGRVAREAQLWGLRCLHTHTHTPEVVVVAWSSLRVFLRAREGGARGLPMGLAVFTHTHTQQKQTRRCASTRSGQKTKRGNEGEDPAADGSSPSMPLLVFWPLLAPRRRPCFSTPRSAVVV